MNDTLALLTKQRIDLLIELRSWRREHIPAEWRTEERTSNAELRALLRLWNQAKRAARLAAEATDRLVESARQARFDRILEASYVDAGAGFADSGLPLNPEGDPAFNGAFNRW